MEKTTIYTAFPSDLYRQELACEILNKYDRTQNNRLGYDKGKIDVIKNLRSALGIGLKESKEIFETYHDDGIGNIGETKLYKLSTFVVFGKDCRSLDDEPIYDFSFYSQVDDGAKNLKEVQLVSRSVLSNTEMQWLISLCSIVATPEHDLSTIHQVGNLLTRTNEYARYVPVDFAKRVIEYVAQNWSMFDQFRL